MRRSIAPLLLVLAPFGADATNIRHVRQLAGTEEIHEIVGKPYDLDEILGAVRQAGAESVPR